VTFAGGFEPGRTPFDRLTAHEGTKDRIIQGCSEDFAWSSRFATVAEPSFASRLNGTGMVFSERKGLFFGRSGAGK
jgi:hypothetical protein